MDDAMTRSDDFYKFKMCIKNWTCAGGPPCQNCTIARRTACVRIKTRLLMEDKRTERK